MPWVLLLRWVVRLAAGLFFWRVVTARRNAYATGTPPVRGPAAARRINTRAAALAIREGVSLGWRAVTAATLLVVASLLIDAGISLVVLSPRWLGAVLLGLAVIVVAALYVEARALWRIIARRRRRHHDELLRREI
jgi:hypothetical protein